MASEKAKELARQQKEAIRAEKLRKKNSDDPRDWGRTRQLVETYKRTAEIDPKLPLLMWGSAIGIMALFGVLAIWIPPWWLTAIFGGLFGVLAAMFVMTSRAKKAMFTRYHDQPGAAEVALSMLSDKKWRYTSGITVTRTFEVIHRAVGRPGIVLIGEGKSTARVQQLLAAEVKKHENVAYGVPVTAIIMGDGDKQVPLAKLQKHIEKLPKVIAAHEVTEVTTRLRALDSVRPKVPMPKGPMPKAKGVGRALRGR